MISVSGLNKTFQHYHALNDIHFTVERGEVISIIGPSGSGKSTLLRSLNLLVKPDSGQLMIGDMSVDTRRLSRSETHRFRRLTAMVFQHYNLFRNKTALENITEVLIYGRGWSRADAAERGMALLTSVGLAHKAAAYPATLSGGQQQRVGIARALSLEPEVLLLDEPTSSLDPELRRDILNLIAALAERDFTMLIVTHEMHFARDISHRLFFMEQGRIIEQGPPAELFDITTGGRARHFLHDVA
ncbi:amino acid ABC transporter ATP-binding protein [Pseudomonas cerasi]